MVLSRLSLVSGMALVIAACTGSSGDSTAPAEATSTTIQTTTSAPAPVVGDGRLAIVEDDGTVALLDPDGSDRVAITDAAGDSIYTQPIWSPDSTRLAFGQLSEEGFAVRVEPVSGDESVSVPVSNNPFFMHWSPDSRRIGVLHNGAQGLDFEMVDVAAGTIEILDTGSPFYFSWNEDSDRVAVHVGPERFEAMDLSGESTPLGATSAGYLAPQWLPQGILHVFDDELVVRTDDEPIVLAGVGEQTMFVADTDGSRVALQSLAPRSQTVAMGQAERVRDNAVAVVDTRSLEVEVVDTQPAVGMWWSPDGRSLLLLTPNLDGSSVTAKVWSDDDGLVEYVSYVPSALQVRDVFPFFPQYAQSMTFWSPDSSGFAIAGEIGGENGVWVQALGGSDPILVSDGLWVAWSGE